ncbi:MAG: hypothetical protein GTO54_03475 [Nitrososphaeria archaeon]|nr:hypothetical protein [Nitrososphaeria archaeon]
MITEALIDEASFELLRRSMKEIPEDWEVAYRDAYKEETLEMRRAYDYMFAAMNNARREGLSICLDSGSICFYITLGTAAQIDPKINFWRALARSTMKATKDGILNPYTVDPLTRENTHTNVGVNMPSLEYNTVTEEECIEITSVLKGAGAELSGSRFRMMAAADGLLGIKRFVLDKVIHATRYGWSCPPNIYGIGVGGVMAIASRFAMMAATLRPYGSRHPMKKIAELEEELKENINSIGVGAMGNEGNITALDVHIEYSYGQSALLPVAIVSQCFVPHRATARICSDGAVEYHPYPKLWFTELRKTIPEFVRR